MGLTVQNGGQVDVPQTKAALAAAKAAGLDDPLELSPLATPDQVKLIKNAKQTAATMIGLGAGIPAGSIAMKVLSRSIDVGSPGAVGALGGLVTGLVSAKVAYKTQSVALGTLAGGATAAGLVTALSLATGGGVPEVRALAKLAAAGAVVGLVPAYIAKQFAK